MSYFLKKMSRQRVQIINYLYYLWNKTLYIYLVHCYLLLSQKQIYLTRFSRRTFFNLITFHCKKYLSKQVDYRVIIYAYNKIVLKNVLSTNHFFLYKCIFRFDKNKSTKNHYLDGKFQLIEITIMYNVIGRNHIKQ